MYLNTSIAAPKLLWTLSGNQGNQWFSGRLPFATVKGPYQIYFEGIRGATHMGDIAVDDVSFTSSSCGCKYFDSLHAG